MQNLECLVCNWQALIRSGDICRLMGPPGKVMLQETTAGERQDLERKLSLHISKQESHLRTRITAVVRHPKQHLFTISFVQRERANNQVLNGKVQRICQILNSVLRCNKFGVTAT